MGPYYKIFGTWTQKLLISSVVVFPSKNIFFHFSHPIFLFSLSLFLLSSSFPFHWARGREGETEPFSSLSTATQK